MSLQAQFRRQVVLQRRCKALLGGLELRLRSAHSAVGTPRRNPGFNPTPPEPQMTTGTSAEWQSPSLSGFEGVPLGRPQREGEQFESVSRGWKRLASLPPYQGHLGPEKTVLVAKSLDGIY